MSSNRSKKLLKTIFTANAGCGCGKPKLSDVFEPTRKPKIPAQKNPNCPSSGTLCCKKNSVVSTISADNNDNDNEDYATTTSTTTVDCSASSFSQPSSVETDPVVQKCSKKMNDTCIAVVKESNDPYEDFKQSMKQMIVEKEIYDNHDLQELLSCFLELNSPSHRDVIVRAFTDIWNDVVSKKQQKKQEIKTECLDGVRS
ncbi:Ovate protein family, C-terminal [Trema orientale]|uniref:Transcription repressor n=1 Tax=Trema orientale TaxID=63057 RepID=A0A2P5CPI3_TREOI|nr:Ovate protein family, C-terminal [Trema orientale]